jgi:hypothetical protein
MRLGKAYAEWLERTLTLCMKVWNDEDMSWSQFETETSSSRLNGAFRMTPRQFGWVIHHDWNYRNVIFGEIHLRHVRLNHASYSLHGCLRFGAAMEFFRKAHIFNHYHKCKYLAFSSTRAFLWEKLEKIHAQVCESTSFGQKWSRMER